MRPAPDQPRYSVGTALLAWVGAFSVGVFGGAIVLALTGYTHTAQDALPLWVLALSNVPLSLGLIGATAVVSRLFGTGRLRDDYGLRFRLVDLWGIPVGVVVQLVFIRLLYVGLRGLGLDTSKVEDPAKQLTSRSLPEIGRKFGNRDHTTVMHAVSRVTELMEQDADFGERVELLRRMLES